MWGKFCGKMIDVCLLTIVAGWAIRSMAKGIGTVRWEMMKNGRNPE